MSGIREKTVDQRVGGITVAVFEVRSQGSEKTRSEDLRVMRVTGIRVSDTDSTARTRGSKQIPGSGDEHLFERPFAISFRAGIVLGPRQNSKPAIWAGRRAVPQPARRTAARRTRFRADRAGDRRSSSPLPESTGALAGATPRTHLSPRRAARPASADREMRGARPGGRPPLLVRAWLQREMPGSRTGLSALNADAPWFDPSYDFMRLHPISTTRPRKPNVHPWGIPIVPDAWDPNGQP